MRIIIVAILVLGLLALYLNRSYARFYDLIGKAHLPTPYTKTTLEITNSNVKATKPLKYIAMGDSLTAGIGSTSYLSSYPYIFAQKLSTRKNLPITLINLGIPGAKTHDLFKQIDQVKEENPDYITLLIGINDIQDHHLSDQFNVDLNYLLSNLTQTKATILLINIPFLGYKSSLLPPYNFIVDYQTQQYNKTTLALSKKYHLQYIDLYDQTKKAFAIDPTLYSKDLFHPSDKGYIVWGQFIDAD